MIYVKRRLAPGLILNHALPIFVTSLALKTILLFLKWFCIDVSQMILYSIISQMILYSIVSQMILYFVSVFRNLFFDPEQYLQI